MHYGCLEIRDADQYDIINTIPTAHEQGLEDFLTDADDEVIISCGGGLGRDLEIKVWEIAGGECLKTVKSPWSYDLSLSPDGNHMAANADQTDIVIFGRRR